METRYSIYKNDFISNITTTDFTSWFGDLDLGEMFLNYPLDVSLQPYAGVEVTEAQRLTILEC